MIEIELKKEDDFLKIKETLTRIGVSSENTNILYQTCHILHKRGRYYIVHFKEMLLLDGILREPMTDNDYLCRNFIATFLGNIGLCKVISKDFVKNNNPGNLKVLKSEAKKFWKLLPKYCIGKNDGKNV